MNRLIVAGVAVVAAGFGALGWALTPLPAPASMLAAPPMDEAAVARGAYLARLGDCGACHTAKDGAPMAGGVAFDTPFGRVTSPNITPDPTTGIGRYTLAQFEGALRRGVGGAGDNLYPAMPYPSFARISDDDVRSLYAYFIKGVAPVDRPNTPDAMRFPFNIRLGLGLWKTAFFDPRRFVDDPSQDGQWNRGAYIVEGLGHCGACHTPRGIGMQEVTTRPEDAAYLSGATVPPWYAVSLRNAWRPDAIAQFLKTGVNGHAAAFGSMTEVVTDSTQYVSDADLAAVAGFLASLSTGSGAPSTTVAGSVPETLTTTRGGLGYDQFCSSCHGRDGRGAPGVFPPLAGNDSVTSDDPTSVVHVALTGWREATTRHANHAFTMPAYDRLSDTELAEILTFARTNWGNDGAAITAAQVEAQRRALALAPTPPSPFTVWRFADMLAAPNADQLVLGMRLLTETKALLPDNVGDALTCSSCHLNGGTVADASPFNGLVALFPTYNARAGRVISIDDRINGCFQRSMNGKPMATDSKAMQAMVAAMAWMKGDTTADGAIVGRGFAEVDAALVPDRARGETLFAANCAVCHGLDGRGAKAVGGQWLIPPLWGDESFNLGAGMARTFIAASFVKSNMPVAHSTSFPQGQGGLADQDALDVADYFTHRPRPDFPGKVEDWPKGETPKDARR
ncbi:thiosulfate dehydrogenase [Roseiarcus fermentans]|uniref:Thiosulfate dehydrogenase n=1 Tax=Roseiarcus fermentans TaxID=1473586 RepID=A0A366FQK9_9HYPH|nr:c-type cytochrome [Roseiarcus fermentans]RBP16831.1 thiosulfate dehydrogenase [Roseiarcus fermentans]